jgi:hypothetical protein
MLSTKSLLNKRLAKKPLKKVFPSKTEGENGDLQLTSIGKKGQFLLGKIDGNWYSAKLSSLRDSNYVKSKKIKTSNIYGKGGLTLSLESESISTSIYTGKTATTTTYSQPILKIGDGTSAGVISSLANQDLILKTGNSTTSNISITDGSNGSITSTLNGSGKFDIIFNSTDADDSRLRVLNTSSGNSSMTLAVSNGAADNFIKYVYIADSPSNNISYVLGMDGSATGNPFVINYGEGATGLTPSNGTTLLKIENDGDVTVTKDLLVTGDITSDGGDVIIDVSSGDPKLKFQIGGSTKYSIGLDDSDSDLFKINSGATIADPSDFEMDSSGNVTVTGTLTSSAGVCGGPAITNHITNNAADIMAV